MKNEGTEKLIESVYQSVLECGEVATKEDVIGIAVELEQEEGIEFESSDIVIAFYEGNDAGIDAFVENAEGTPDSEWDADSKADYISDMEAQRPSKLRKQSLTDALASF